MPPSPRRPWTDADDTRLRELADAGTSVRAIAAELDRSKSAVERRLRALRTGVNRTGTVAATKARQIDAKARRAAIVQRIYTRAEAILARLEQPGFDTIMRGAMGAETTERLTFVPAREERELASALTQLLTSATRLEQLDADGGAAAAVGMLDQIGKAISAAAEAMGNPDPDDPNG